MPQWRAPHKRTFTGRLGAHPAERLCGLLAAIGVAATLVLALIVAPPDAVQGQAQRLMYLHVPAAWLAYACFAVTLVASIGYLVRRDLRADRLAQATAELGVGMTALTIVMGSLWARPTWGVWWAWDARVVTTVILLLIYIGYLGVRGLSDDAHLNARRSAVIGVLGFLDVPVVHFSVLWWRTLHQPPTVAAPSTSPPIATIMLVTLFTSLVAFTLLAGYVVSRRVRALAAVEAEAEPSDSRDVDRGSASPIIVRAGAR